MVQERGKSGERACAERGKSGERAGKERRKSGQITGKGRATTVWTARDPQLADLATPQEKPKYSTGRVLENIARKLFLKSRPELKGSFRQRRENASGTVGKSCAQSSNKA